MDIKGIKKVLPALLRAGVKPLLCGQQGAGKTEVSAQVATSMGLPFIHLNCGVFADPGDLIGMMKHNPDGTVSHSRPTWFPDKPAVILLDEVNRAHPDIIQALFSFVQSGRLHTHQLPEGCFIIGAANFNNNQFTVTDTSDLAWMSRWCHLDFDPSVNDVVTFFDDKGYHSLAEFIRDNPDLRAVRQNERLNYALIQPNGRSFEQVGRLDNVGDIDDYRYEVYSGILGQTVAARYIADRKDKAQRISGRKILFEYSKVRAKVLETSTVKAEKSTRFDLLNSALDEVLGLLEGKTHKPEYIDNFKQFLLDIPLELLLTATNKMSKLENWPQRANVMMDPVFINKVKTLKGSKK
jgi:hypothetical protein